ncbi:MAG: hypothetical protein AMJ94_17735 [Deltaproteobacteria bacterium SM23_61]|nr:MAG: hypothetical protein AMJ94_17735 [Deltaproteobacteria bacterium SM23_61]
MALYFDKGFSLLCELCVSSEAGEREKPVSLAEAPRIQRFEMIQNFFLLMIFLKRNLWDLGELCGSSYLG